MTSQVTLSEPLSHLYMGINRGCLNACGHVNKDSKGSVKEEYKLFIQSKVSLVIIGCGGTGSLPMAENLWPLKGMGKYKQM